MSDKPVVEGWDKIGPECTCPNSDYQPHRHIGMTRPGDTAGATDGDRERAAAVAWLLPAATDETGWSATVDAIADALAAERARALQPVRELADKWRSTTQPLALQLCGDDLGAAIGEVTR